MLRRRVKGKNRKNVGIHTKILSGFLSSCSAHFFRKPCVETNRKVQPLLLCATYRYQGNPPGF